MRRPRGFRKLACAGLVLSCAALAGPVAPRAAAQQSAASPPNRLVTGKLIYVGPMPDGLDRWLQEDLKTWGRYRVTSNPEGVDLEMNVIVPERQPQYRERHGVPLPKKESRDKPRETSIDVVDWVSGERVWSATLLDKKIDHNAPPPAPGPTLEIRARGMTPDQLALRITTELRRYVEQLESTAPH
ncbi:MAG TPA: hypothetical protein VL523_14490 [Terriglobia bacterium]|nr:hypothetical protein [Terriglobia bacterium]